MTIARLTRTVLACLHLLVGIGLGWSSVLPAAHHASSVSAFAADCAGRSDAAAASHHAAKSPGAPAGGLADHRHCPQCPTGGACADLQFGTPVVVVDLVPVRSADPLGPHDTAAPTGRNPLPDPRPPRAVV